MTPQQCIEKTMLESPMFHDPYVLRGLVLKACHKWFSDATIGKYIRNLRIDHKLETKRVGKILWYRIVREPKQGDLFNEK